MLSFNKTVDSAFNYIDDVIARSIFYTSSPKKQIIPPTTDCIVYSSDDGEKTTVIPNITNVKVIKEKVVIVSFADGAQEKAICAEGDTFSVENGVTICLMKKLLADKCRIQSGTSIYNKLVKIAMDNVGADEKKKQKEKEKIRAEKKARKEAHDAESQKRRNNKKYMIDICTEALKKVLAEAENH